MSKYGCFGTQSGCNTSAEFRKDPAKFAIPIVSQSYLGPGITCAKVLSNYVKVHKVIKIIPYWYIGYPFIHHSKEANSTIRAKVE